MFDICCYRFLIFVFCVNSLFFVFVNLVSLVCFLVSIVFGVLFMNFLLVNLFWICVKFFFVFLSCFVIWVNLVLILIRLVIGIMILRLLIYDVVYVGVLFLLLRSVNFLSLVRDVKNVLLFVKWCLFLLDVLVSNIDNGLFGLIFILLWMLWIVRMNCLIYLRLVIVWLLIFVLL